MGVHGSATVLYGILDDEKLRTLQEPRSYRACPNGHGRSASDFCGKCGAPMELQTEMVTEVVPAMEFYGEEWIHHSGGYGGDLLVGKALAHVGDITGSGGGHVDVNIEDEDRWEVNDFLADHGIETEPQLWLVTYAG